MKSPRIPTITPASGGFRAGMYRPDPPKPEAVSVSEGPDGPRDIPEPQSARADGQRLREQTAKNIAAHKAALAPRRYGDKA